MVGALLVVVRYELQTKGNDALIGRVAYPTGEVGDGDVFCSGNDLKHFQLIPWQQRLCGDIEELKRLVLTKLDIGVTGSCAQRRVTTVGKR